MVSRVIVGTDRNSITFEHHDAWRFELTVGSMDEQPAFDDTESCLRRRLDRQRQEGQRRGHDDGQGAGSCRRQRALLPARARLSSNGSQLTRKACGCAGSALVHDIAVTQARLPRASLPRGICSFPLTSFATSRVAKMLVGVVTRLALVFIVCCARPTRRMQSAFGASLHL